MIAIETHCLTKRFPRTTGFRDLLPRFVREQQFVNAVQDVSFRVQSGELFGLLGPNGAGKTTLMKILCTLVVPTAGTAYVHGRDVVREEQAVKELVGLITAEERSFYWRLTARQNLEFYASLYNMTGSKMKVRIDELLRMVGLEQDADMRFQSYSAGMKQKLAIARGLLSDPSVLLIDEPTRSLDPESARTVRRLLRERVLDSGKTAILATHNMSEAEQLCDRLAIMNHGRIIAVGTVQDIRALFQSQQKCELEVRHLSDALLRQLCAVNGVLDCRKTHQWDGLSTIELRFSDCPSVLPEVLKTVVFMGGEVCNFSLELSSLEEIFVKALQARRASEAGERDEA